MTIMEMDYNKENTVPRANRLFLCFCLFYFSSRLLRTLYMNYQIELYGLDAAKDIMANFAYPVVLFNELVLVLLPSLIYVFVYRLNIPFGFRFNRLGFKNLSMILLLSIPLYVFLSSANYLTFYFLQSLGNIPTREWPMPKNGGEFVLVLFLTAFLPAVCEEFFLRGILLNAYNRRGALGAIMSGGIFFAVFHFDVTNVLAPFFFGLVIGYIVLKTNSIYAGILAHFLNNALAYTWQCYFADPKAPRFVRIVYGDLPALGLQFLLSLIVVLLILIAVRAMNKEQILKKPIRNPFLGAVDIITHWPVLLSFGLYAFMVYLVLL